MFWGRSKRDRISVSQNENNDAAYQTALEIAKQIADKVCVLLIECTKNVLPLLKKGPVAVSMAKLSIDNGMQVSEDKCINVALHLNQKTSP